MNTLAKFVAPVAVAFAAFGAQASEVLEWDTTSQYQAGSRSAVSAPQAPSSRRSDSSTAEVAPGGRAAPVFTGEVVPGSLAAAPVEAGRTVAPSAPTIATPAQGVFGIGA